jgi:hypothetical protein
MEGVPSACRPRCQNDAVTIREWWAAKVRAGEQNSARAAASSRSQAIAGARRLQDLADDELIAAAPPQSSLARPHHTMEMQRRLKDSIEALTAESRKARIWAAWGSAVVGALTLVLVALTIVLAMKP